MSDRILIMHEGRISGEVQAEEATEDILLSYCYGRADQDDYIRTD
jgi:ABC-type sugar transport system ATPase subunit